MATLRARLAIPGSGQSFPFVMDVASDLRAGLLEPVLSGWHAGDTPIVALFPDRVTMPRKTRIFLDAMIDAMKQPQEPGFRAT